MGHSLTTFQNTEFCLYERKISLTSCFIKNIYFLQLLLPWGVNICLYRHNILMAHFLTFSST
jgi:hypothetical protein